jgi:hypothetical protein
MQTKVNLDSEFDQITTIESLTVNNLGETPFGKMLEILSPLVLVQIPENEDTITEKRRLDYLLARTANLHAYLRVLWCHATHQRARAVKAGLESADEWAKKKEALYELANAVKLKYESASRRITVALDDEDKPERAYYEGRRERRDNKAAPKSGGWSNLG